MPIYKRGDKWHFTKTINGVRYRCALPTARTKAQAEEAERKMLAEIHQGLFGRPAGKAVFIDFAEQVYLPWSKENKRSDSDRYHVAAFKDFFGRKTFAEISPMLIEKFKSERRKGLTRGGKPRSPASVNRELACLSSIFSMAMRKPYRLISENPCSEVSKLREENARNRYLTPEEEGRLLAACSAPLRPIVILAINTGMRRGELLSLRWREVDFRRGEIHLTRTKSGKPRTVPINSAVREELLKLQDNSSEWVFPGKDSHRAGIKRAFRQACKAAGIEDLRFHDLRHTAATRWQDAGVEQPTIMALLGHRDPRMTMRYSHATDQAKRRAVEEAISRQPGHNLVTMKKRE